MQSKQTIYIHGHHESVLRSHSWRTVENSAAYLLQHVHPSMHILDIGCGPGTITIDLAGHVPNGRVVGLDSSAEVLEQAQRRVGRPDIDLDHQVETLTRGAVEFVLGDAQKLDFADGTFDIVHAHQVLQHLADPVQALREMRRVVKPGGIVAVRSIDSAGMVWYPESSGLSTWHALHTQISRSNSGEPNAGRMLHAWAREAGFNPGNISKSATVWCYSTEEEREWWGGLWADRVVSSTFAKHALEKKYASEEDLLRLSQAWKEWAEHDDGWFAILHGEIICHA